MWTDQWGYVPDCGYSAPEGQYYENFCFVGEPSCGQFVTFGQPPTFWSPQPGNSSAQCYCCCGAGDSSAFYAIPQPTQIPYTAGSSISSADSQPLHPTIRQQIESLNRGIAKYLRLTEVEKFTDPEFAEWCHGTAEELMNCRDLLMLKEPTMYGSVGQPENIWIEESRTLPIVDEQRVLGHQQLTDQQISEVPQVDMSYLEPTENLANNLHAVIISYAKDMESERQVSLVTADHFEMDDKVVGTIASNTMSSDSDQTPIEDSEIRSFVPISLNSDSEFCPKSVVHFPLLRQPLSEGVDVKWSKRRLKAASLDRVSSSDCGLSTGIGFDKLRGFRWTKRRMKRANYVKFGLEIRRLDQSGTIDCFRGSGGVNGRKKRKKGMNPRMDEGMLRWAEKRMRRWREGTAVRIVPNHRLENPGMTRGNSKFDRGLNYLRSGLKAMNSARNHGCSYSDPLALKEVAACSTTQRPFG